MDINFLSVYAAAQEAVKSFKALPADVKKTFIFTGNRMNNGPILGMLAAGAGKAASAHMMDNAARAYTSSGYRYTELRRLKEHMLNVCSFYYGDERNADGTSVGGKISGENHGQAYWELANSEDQGPWDYTFVGGKGYINVRDKFF